jgi:hypothetical protein
MISDECLIKHCGHLFLLVVDRAIKALETANLSPLITYYPSVSPLITKDNFPLTQNVDLEDLQRQKANDILDTIKITYQT